MYISLIDKYYVYFLKTKLVSFERFFEQFSREKKKYVLAVRVNIFLESAIFSYLTIRVLKQNLNTLL